MIVISAETTTIACLALYASRLREELKLRRRERSFHIPLARDGSRSKPLPASAAQESQALGVREEPDVRPSGAAAGAGRGKAICPLDAGGISKEHCPLANSIPL